MKLSPEEQKELEALEKRPKTIEEINKLKELDRKVRQKEIQPFVSAQE
jgi:hypothetical protein